MITIPAIPEIQQQGYDLMCAARALRDANHPEGFTFNPYPVDTVERVNFNVGCLVAVFPKLQ